MAKQYVSIRLWKETYIKLQKKQDNMSKAIEELTGKPTKIPFPRILDKAMNEPLKIENKELIKLRKWRKI